MAWSKRPRRSWCSLQAECSHSAPSSNNSVCLSPPSSPLQLPFVPSPIHEPLKQSPPGCCLLYRASKPLTNGPGTVWWGLCMRNPNEEESLTHPCAALSNNSSDGQVGKRCVPSVWPGEILLIVDICSPSHQGLTNSAVNNSCWLCVNLLHFFVLSLSTGRWMSEVFLSEDYLETWVLVPGSFKSRVFPICFIFVIAKAESPALHHCYAILT